MESGPEASRHCDISGFGSVEEHITEWNEGRDFTYYATGVGPISDGDSTWSVKPDGEKTIVYADLRYGVRFGPLGGLMNGIILRRKIEQGLGKALDGLKDYVMASEPVTA